MTDDKPQSKPVPGSEVPPPMAGAAEPALAGAEAATLSPGRRRSMLLWLVPLLLLLGVGGGIWWFVLRDTPKKRAERVLAEARAAYDLFEYDRAEKLLLQAREMIPTGAKGSGMNVGVHHNLGLLYRRLERWEEARDAFMKAATFCGPDANEVRAEELFQVALIEIYLGHTGPAGDALRAALEAHPTRPVLHLSLIDLQLGYLKRPTAADSCLQDFLRLCGRAPENLRDAAQIYFRRKFMPDALILAKAAAAAQDTMISAHVLVAKAYWRSGRSQEGLEYLEGPLTRYPQSVVLWSTKASLLVGAGRFDEAVQTADHALTLAPDDYETHRARMMALYNGNRHQEAIDEAMVCRKMATNPNEIHFLESMLARIHARQQGKPEPMTPTSEGGSRSHRP